MFARFGRDRQVPERPPALDHVPRGRADGTDERPHVIRLVEHHSFASEAVDVRRLELRRGVINLEVQRRLVVYDDKENVGPRGLHILSDARRHIQTERNDQGDHDR